jgi:hypothetical protein
MRTKIVTCIYSNLYGTKFGGRINRGYHYINSVRSMLKMTDADFVLYTAEEEVENLTNYLGEYENLTIKTYDLGNHYWKDKFEQYKDFEDAKTSDRCLEVQYMKLYWMNEEATSEYDRVYWFDAGLSYTGLIPDKYMDCKGEYISGESYYLSSLFNNTFLSNLNTQTEDKCFLILKENHLNFWAHEPRECFINEYDGKWHVIGGVIGGDRKLINDLFTKFDSGVDSIIEKYNKIQWHEENILTVLYYNYPELFTTDYFDTWWHENNIQAYLNEDNLYFTINRSFYKVLEKLQ